MRTLLLAPELFRAEGGIARILRCYLRALAELTPPDGQVDCLALNDGPAPPATVARHLAGRRGSVRGAGCSKWRFVRSALELGLGADRVVCGHLHQLVVAWLARGLGGRFDYHLVAHGIDVWRPFTWLERRALRGATTILCVSDYTRRQMLRFDPGLDPGRLVVVPNTVGGDFGARGGSPETTGRVAGKPRSLAGGAAAFPRLLAVSRLTRDDDYKGIDLVIEAMPAIRREFPQAILRIVGGGDDRLRLEALARRLALAGEDGAPASASATDAVQFAGMVPEEALRAEYEACDLFVLPSRREGFGLVYLEAMSHGKPCVAARAGGAPEVVGDWRTSEGEAGAEPAADGAGPETLIAASRTGYSPVGVVVDYGDTGQLALAVADLVHHPRDPGAIRARAELFSFDTFKHRLAAALEPGPSGRTGR